jgi:hypothetical protein
VSIATSKNADEAYQSVKRAAIDQVLDGTDCTCDRCASLEDIAKASHRPNQLAIEPIIDL